MLNLKKTAIAVLALGSSAVFAGTMGPVCTPGSVTVPCERSAWNFGAEALYLNNSGTDLIGAIYDTVTDNNGDDNWGWGFKLEGSYHFGTGNDINVNWYHLDRTRTAAFGNFVVDPLVFVNNSLTTNPEWDAVNVEFGQMVNFGEHKVIRFHGGLQFAQIERNGTFNSNGVQQFHIEQENNAVGPRAGMDMSYHFGNGLAVYANGATGLLVGNNKFKLNGVTVAHRDETVTPEMELALGVTYTYSMAQGDLMFDAGYMVVNYFNALHSTPLVTGDYSLSGVKFGATWTGNFA